MSTESALQKYTRAVAAAEDHQEANRAIFDAHKRYVMAIMDAENELRDAAAESLLGANDGIHIVTVTPTTQTVYNEDQIRAVCAKAGVSPETIISVNQRPPRITVGKVSRAG